MKKLLSIFACASVAASAGAAGLSPANYVQDGLVLQFDGLDNVGTGTHDSSATKWVDLKGSASVATKAGIGFGARSLRFDFVGSQPVVNFPSGLKNNPLTLDFSVNLISNRTTSTTTTWPQLFYGPDAYLHSTGMKAGDGTVRHFRFFVNGTDPRPYVYDVYTNTLCCVSDASSIRILKDGVQSQSCEPKAARNYGSFSFNHSCYKVEFYSFRIYNRGLSTDEAMQNSVVEHLRYFAPGVNGGGATADWSAATWTDPDGASVAVPSTATNGYAVVKNATLNISVADAVGLQGLSLEDGAKLDVAADAVVAARYLFVEGQQIPRGIYTGSGTVGEKVGWLTGTGVVRVANSASGAFPEIWATPGADGWYQFGITSTEGAKTWLSGKWYIIADWPKWSQLAFPQGAKARFVGYTILDTIPEGMFAETDFSQAEYILLHGQKVFADGSKFTIPVGTELRYQPGTWTASADVANQYRLDSEGSGIMTTPLEINGSLHIHGDGTHLARQHYNGPITGTGKIWFQNFSNQGRFSGPFALNGTVTGYENGHVLWVDTTSVTSSLRAVKFSNCGEKYQTNTAHNVNGIMFGVENSTATADHELYIASVCGQARDITDKKGKRWRCGGFLAVWGGNTIHVGKLYDQDGSWGSLHVVGQNKDLGCTTGFISSANAVGEGNLVVDDVATPRDVYLSTNVLVTVGKVTAATTFNYTYYANAVNHTTLDITNSCVTSAKLKATDLAMLPARLSGFNGSVTLTGSEQKAYTIPVDLTQGTNLLYQTVGCIGSGTLAAAPATGTIDVTFPTTRDALPVLGEYALARFSAGGEKLANWTVTLNGAAVSSVNIAGINVQVKKDATGLWLKAAKSGVTLIFR